VSYGPNEMESCPSRGCLVRSRAHGRICPVCEPEAEWAVRCPLCFQVATAVGVVVQDHAAGGRGLRMRLFDCPGAGLTVALPVVADRPIWSGRRRPYQPLRRARSMAVLVPGGAK